MEHLSKIEDLPSGNNAGVVRLTWNTNVSARRGSKTFGNTTEQVSFADVQARVEDKRYLDFNERDRILADARKMMTK